MAGFPKVVPLLFLLLLCENSLSAADESKEELVQSESKDGTLEIIKQIKKVNDDGSYTIGYEADDGSFKIESRDVLGNVKGTYGFIDDEGQIKRVSYSTSNSSEVVSKPETSTSSVVQRIPSKVNKTTTYITKRPGSIYSTTQSTPTSTTISQRYSKVRNGLSSTTSTTKKPNYSEVVNMDSEISKTTSKPFVYSTSTPRILLQGRPIVRSTPATHTQTQKSEGQLIRPEVVTARPTELPLFKRLALKHGILSEAKPVTEEPEVRSNILRRQLSQENPSDFDAQQHVFTLQQALGNDATDVYSGSVTTGTPRPLFTTTSRPRALLSSTSSPVLISRPTVRYPVNYQRNGLEDVESNTQEYAQETSTAPSLSSTTPTSGPIVQIPANRPTQEPLVAIRHPFQRGTILVPLSQIQGGVVPVENLRDVNGNQAQYETSNDQYIKETTPRPTQPVQQRPIFVRRLPVPPPQFRPIPVQVDENGYIREPPQQPNAAPTPYPLPIPITPSPKYINSDAENDIDQISPPVSTRDFQKLLQQLIIRQSRLERISELTNLRRHPELFQPRYRPVYRPTPVPYYAQRMPETQQNGPIQFEENFQRQRQYVQVPQQVLLRAQQRQEQELYNQRQQQRQDQELYNQRQQQRQDQELYNQRQQYSQDEQSYAPTRRVARLLQPGHHEMEEGNEEYLPTDVREMLLLRMLQLAINPALPLAGEEERVESTATTPVPQYKKAPVRNVEILGEESEEEKKAVRTKRYKELDMDYYDEQKYA